MRKVLLSQNEQEIKLPIKLVGVWFLPNWWGVRSYTAFGIIHTREKQMAEFKGEEVCIDRWLVYSVTLPTVLCRMIEHVRVMNYERSVTNRITSNKIV
jgi:hypothetical protein